MDTTIEKTYTAENILKKQRKNIKDLENKARNKFLNRQSKRNINKLEKVLPPEHFIKKYRSEQNSYKKIKKNIKKIERKDIELPSSKLIVVLRIRGLNSLSDQVKRIFKYLRLTEVNSAVFLKVDEKIMKNIKKIEQYVTYGYPSRKLVSELIYKKGFAKINNERQQLTDNEKIEKAFGEKGIICLEDVVHEIMSCGEHFISINSFLYPFKLSQNSKDLLKNRKLPFSKNGEWGNREEKINELLFQMI